MGEVWPATSREWRGNALKAPGLGPSIKTVSYEMTIHTRMGLMDHDLALVLAHPIAKLATDPVAQMLHDLRSEAPTGKRIIGFDL
jgi:hypothetical protein